MLECLLFLDSILCIFSEYIMNSPLIRLLPQIYLINTLYDPPSQIFNSKYIDKNDYPVRYRDCDTNSSKMRTQKPHLHKSKLDRSHMLM